MKPPDPTRRRLIRWLWRLPVLATVVGGGIGLGRAWRIHFGKRTPSLDPAFRSIDTVAIAEVEAFRAPWSAVSFVVAGVPSVALHVPVEVAGAIPIDDGWIAGFSRVCPHRGCLVDLHRSPEAIALATNYRGDSPALVCPCHRSVFLPTRQGRAVSGPAVFPLPRLRLEVRAGAVAAVGIEG